MQLKAKTLMSISEMYEQRHICIPEDINVNINELSYSALKISIDLCSYFSTETGRTLQQKEFSLIELMKKFDVSRGTIKKAVNEIIEKKIFLVYEDNTSKEKVYVFFVNNKKNQEIFNELKNGESIFKVKKIYQKVKNKITSIAKKMLPSEQKNVSRCQNFDRIENAKIQEIKELEPFSKISQESYKEETNIKNHTYQEKENNLAIKKETEIIQNECDDFKDFKKDEKIQEIKILSKEQEIKNNKEDILKNFGIKTKSLKNLNEILSLEKQFIMDSIEKVKFLMSEGKCSKKEGFLLSILKKAVEANKNNPYEIKKEPENKITEELKNRVIDFALKTKLILSKLGYTPYCDAVFSLPEKYKNIDFLRALKEVINYDELKMILENHINTQFSFKIRFSCIKDEMLLNFQKA